MRRLLAAGALFSTGCLPDSATAFRDGLLSKECSGISDPSLRDTCWTAAGRCEEVEAPRNKEDCAFRAAEAANDPTGCERAGEWTDDCRIHVWSASFRGWAPKGTDLVNAEPLVAEQVKKFGFAPEDPRPWSAWYRWLLGRMRPMDRESCRKLPDPAHAEACLQTGLSLYGDLLNVSRDRHLYPCDGGPLPSLLLTTPDPELDDLRASRTDLCPP